MSKVCDFIDGDPVYGETAMRVLSMDPDNRYTEIVQYLEVLMNHIKDFDNPEKTGYRDVDYLKAFTYEAWKHAITALYAMDDMKGRPSVKWEKGFWLDFIKETLNK